MRLILIGLFVLTASLDAQQPANCPLGGTIVAADGTVWACRGTASTPIQVTTGTGTATGTNTGDQSTVSGNAGTATTFQTARNINGVSFNGSANITVTAAGSTLSDAVTFANGGIGACAATSATTGTMTVATTTNCVTVTPSGACTFNGSTGGVAGQILVFMVTTSGSSSFVLTWGTNFHTAGTLATGVTTARFFAVTFMSDGTKWWEISRTTVQT